MLVAGLGVAGVAGLGGWLFRARGRALKSDERAAAAKQGADYRKGVEQGRKQALQDAGFRDVLKSERAKAGFKGPGTAATSGSFAWSARDCEPLI